MLGSLSIMQGWQGHVFRQRPTGAHASTELHRGFH